MASEKRLALLEKLTASGTADSFAWYGLALEYAGFGRVEEALRTLRTLRDKDPSYVPMYLICGAMLSKAGQTSEAREWLEAGIARARTAGNSHAVGELQDALAALPSGEAQ
jgi:predicted Zn-dependent protease